MDILKVEESYYLFDENKSLLICVFAQLICVFVFAYAKSLFSHGEAHISLASFLWVIGKQNSPRCDAVKRDVPFWATLFA